MILIFCQSSSCIPFSISLYKKNTKESRIVVLDLSPAFNYLKSVGFKDLIVLSSELQHGSFKNVNFIIRIYRFLRKEYNKKIKSKDICAIYFFSQHYDYLTFYIVNRLRKAGVRIQYIDIYADHEKRIRKFTFKSLVLLLIFKILTSAPVYLTKDSNSGISIVTLPIDKLGINILEYTYDSIDLKDYSYRIDIPGSSNILLFESNDGAEYDCYLNYESDIKSIVRYLISKGFNIVLKPHPRYGYSEFLKYLIEDEIPDFVPGELIDLSCFKMIIGINSAALAYCANASEIPVFGIGRLLEYTDRSIPIRYENYLLKLSNKIHFVDSFEQITII